MVRCLMPNDCDGSNGPLRVLLLEGVSAAAAQMLGESGMMLVARQPDAMTPEQLAEAIKDVHVLGIRSKTRVTASVLKNATRLLAIGCFCIGTDQVDLAAAAARGVCVFNSPYANSRSVAELVISHCIALSRQVGDRNREMHSGEWRKHSTGCHEVRGRTLGIVGYGHVGSQLSVLAEALGMQVYYYDIRSIMPLGSARRAESLDWLLQNTDIISLHVPETEDTKGMINAKKLKLLQPHAILINAARGKVVDVAALAAALKDKKIAGAAVDVFEQEPAASHSREFVTHLQGCPNTILTPHIGGSTEEAQLAIGTEVATSLVAFVSTGSTAGAVNLPNLFLRSSYTLKSTCAHAEKSGDRRASCSSKMTDPEVSMAMSTMSLCSTISNMPAADTPGQITVRVSNVHHNVPGVLKEINRLLADYNVEKQMCEGVGDISYFLADIKVCSQAATDSALLAQLKSIYMQLSSLEANILTRIIIP